MRRYVALAVAIAISAACAASLRSPSTTPARTAAAVAPTAPAATASSDRASRWRADLASLIPSMARLHPALDHGTRRADLEAAAAALAGKAGSATEDEMLVGLLRVVALVSARGCDAHTGAFIWGQTGYPLESLPLRVWWFEEGLAVIDALAPHGELVGWRLDAIGGRPIAEVLAALDPLVPRDNERTVRLLTPRFVIIPQVLRGLGLVGAGPVSVTLSRAGERRDVILTPIPMRDYNAWAGGYGLFLPSDPGVLYLTRMTEPLWWQTIDDGKTLFVQYNRVEHAAALRRDALLEAMRAPGIERVVVDVRHNYGGEVSAVDWIVNAFTQEQVQARGRLFIVTGRNTFSATALFVARVVSKTSAIVTGEPMSACPTSYGNARPVALSNGIAISVATLLEVGVAADDPRPTIPVELPAPLTLASWSGRADPALAAIRAFRP